MVYLFVDKISVRWYISVGKITIILIIDDRIGDEMRYGFERMGLSSVRWRSGLIGMWMGSVDVDRFDENIDGFNGI